MEINKKTMYELMQCSHIVRYLIITSSCKVIGQYHSNVLVNYSDFFLEIHVL